MARSCRTVAPVYLLYAYDASSMRQIENKEGKMRAQWFGRSPSRSSSRSSSRLDVQRRGSLGPCRSPFLLEYRKSGRQPIRDVSRLIPGVPHGHSLLPVAFLVLASAPRSYTTSGGRPRHCLGPATITVAEGQTRGRTCPSTPVRATGDSQPQSGAVTF